MPSKIEASDAIEKMMPKIPSTDPVIFALADLAGSGGFALTRIAGVSIVAAHHFFGTNAVRPVGHFAVRERTRHEMAARRRPANRNCIVWRLLPAGGTV
jgi:hypothetical protein